MNSNMTFGEAIEHLKRGNIGKEGQHQIARKGWNGNGMVVRLQRPDANSKMERPYLYIVPGAGFTVPWVASQADILTDDWMIII